MTISLRKYYSKSPDLQQTTYQNINKMTNLSAIMDSKIQGQITVLVLLILKLIQQLQVHRSCLWMQKVKSLCGA